jgi:hypothetical protein
MSNEHLTFAELANEERHRILKQRENRKVKTADDNSFVGLSISGGGIRSASFGLGVLQAFNQVETEIPVKQLGSTSTTTQKKSTIKLVDYLSTVSGGGYIGSALTWFNFQNKGKNAPFPFANKAEGARDDLDINKSNNVDFIRQHGNFLAPGNGVTMFSLLMVILRNMLVPFIIYFLLLASLIHGLNALNVFESVNLAFIGKLVPFLSTPFFNDLSFHNGLFLLAASMSILFLFSCLLYALGTYFVPLFKRRDYQLRVKVQIILGIFGTLIVASLLLASIPLVEAWLEQSVYKYLFATGNTLLGTLGAAYHFSQKSQQKQPSNNNLRVILVSFLLIYGLALLAYFVVKDLPDVWKHYSLPILATTLFFALFVNLNYFGIGRMYRDRLAETFLPNRDAVKKNQWQPATEADEIKIDEVSSESEPGPYHIINTNVILIDSKVSKFKGRGGDNFILSPIVCGSYATGWMKSTAFDKGGMTLASAMAISGAAVNPHTGVSGQGLTRNSLVSFLLAMLGIRLGYYVANPFTKENEKKSVLTKLFKPNYIFPGIRQGLLGRGFKRSASYLELSDGGHFENLALYELIKRKLKIIIVSDAGADPKFSFSDLANAIERVRVDFGANIRFNDSEYDLRQIMPGSIKDQDFFTKKYNLAVRGFAIAKIDYGKDEKGEKVEGTLIYLKTTMTKNLPADIYGYKDAHQSFPDQPTSDQFFDEVQLETYRELGYQLTKAMLNDEAVKKVFNPS